MALDSLIHKLIGTVRNGAAGKLRASVTHIPAEGRGTFGPIPGSPVERKALVEFVADVVALPDGTQTRSRNKLTFFEAVAIHERDKFTIPDGAGGVLTSNVLSFKMLLDPAGVPYMTEVWLG